MHTVKRLAGIILALLLLPTFAAMAAGECEACAGKGSTYWIRQLINNRFRINDTTVCYPRFPRFALKVYNWGDRTFNSYDTAYVVGTGKNWKLQAKSYNWIETSTMIFPRNAQISMHSDLFSDAGFSLSFMAVSVGYMWNVNSLFSEPTMRRTFNFDFTCSRFSVSYQSVTSNGGMYITRFGDYREGKHLRQRFDDISINTKNVYAYYFFRHQKYSHAACYTYSKYQLKSAGTALIGANFSEQRTHMDFSSLPPLMLIHNPLETNVYSTHYRVYSALGGYAYNWVLKPRRWCINATGLFGIGYRQIFDNREDTDTREMLANVVNLNLSAVYNHRALFAALTFRGFAHINYNTNFTHLSSILTISAAVGMRF